jgi:hypothetical protein
VGRIAVVVPGIMGSTLHYPGATENVEIWGDDFRLNYARLIKNPQILKWTWQTANARLLKSVSVWNWPSLKIELWKRILDCLKSFPEFSLSAGLFEYGYDWRAPLAETAKLFAEKLAFQVKASSLNLERLSSQSQLTFVTHSMGGFVVRLALALKHLHPSWVDRIIHIGAPLKGAPVAFRVAYDSCTLPFFNELFMLFHLKNANLFKEVLLDCFRSFPSLYELMPPIEVRYLYYSPSVIKNPLEEDFLPKTYRELAERTHQSLIESERVIIHHKIKVFTIYTAVSIKKQTELMYRVESIASPTPGYQVIELIGKTSEGDGTVSAQSACGSGPGAIGNSVLNVPHADLCNSASVADLLRILLSGSGPN